MKMRAMIAALGAALALMVSVAVPASATHWVGDQAACEQRHDFLELFQGNKKNCFAGEGRSDVLNVYLTNVTWVHTGNNLIYIWALDRFGNRIDKYLNPGVDTGCDGCFVESIQIIE